MVASALLEMTVHACMMYTASYIQQITPACTLTPVGMADVADEAISVDDADPAPSEGNHGDADKDVELKDLGASSRAVEVANNNSGGVVEESVTCVITDETSSDWARSRFSYSLPLSSDVGTLYTGVAAQAGEWAV